MLLQPCIHILLRSKKSIHNAKILHLFADSKDNDVKTLILVFSLNLTLHKTKFLLHIFGIVRLRN